MPRSGPIFREMSIARARFKHALKQCRLDEKMLHSNKLSYYMQCRDINSFWKDIAIHNKSKSTLSNSIDGTTNIADKQDVYNSFKNKCFKQRMHVSAAEVIELIRKISNGKAAGLNTQTMFSQFYYLFVLPVCLNGMLNSVIVPLVKNKNGDLSDRNKYRPIALSSTVSKVFRNVIINRLKEYLWASDNQFGYTSGHSTDLCVYALTEFIEYFKSRSTSVYVAFLDASKTFNKINHWVLFKKLIARRVSIYVVNVLYYWY